MKTSNESLESIESDESDDGADTPCVGICLPDEHAAVCIGCGRPWGAATPAPVLPAPRQPEAGAADAPPGKAD